MNKKIFRCCDCLEIMFHDTGSWLHRYDAASFEYGKVDIYYGHPFDLSDRQVYEDLSLL